MTVQPEVPSPAASQATPGGLHMVIGGERVDAADGRPSTSSTRQRAR